jgi:hypothetical protein
MTTEEYEAAAMRAIKEIPGQDSAWAQVTATLALALATLAVAVKDK